MESVNYLTVNTYYPRPEKINLVTTATYADATDEEKKLFHEWSFAEQLTLICWGNPISYAEIVETCEYMLEMYHETFHRNTEETYRIGFSHLDKTLQPLVDSGHLQRLKPTV